MKRRTALVSALTLPFASLPFARACAADEIVIGAIYPLTGNAAQIGADAKAAIDTILEIINGTHDKLRCCSAPAAACRSSAGPRSASCSRTTRTTRRRPAPRRSG